MAFQKFWLGCKETKHKFKQHPSFWTEKNVKLTVIFGNFFYIDTENTNKSRKKIEQNK